MKVFLAITSLRQSYGGPAVAVANLAKALSESGAKIGLWAPDGSAANIAMSSSTTDLQCFSSGLEKALHEFGRPDILHDNGIWLPHNHKLALLAAHHRISRIVTLHGMLEHWAVNHKKWKKRLAWWLYQRRDLMAATCHLATADSEAGTLLGYRLGIPVRVIPNGIDIPKLPFDQNAEQPWTRDSKGPRVALFLGRIYPVKGLPMLIDAWSALRPRGWVLHIAGPDEAGHRTELEARVRAAGLEAAVRFLGPIASDEKHKLYRRADLFVLPSYSENFGMVVGEALANGLPVLTTKATPWSLLSEKRCGWWVEATVRGLEEGLRQATSYEPRMLWQMGARGRSLIAQDFSWPGVVRRFTSVYAEFLNN